MCGMPKLPPAKHEHPLEKSDRATGWGCDGCGCSGEGKERWRCTQGCDFDFCGDCYAKVMAPAEEAKASPPKLMIVDIQMMVASTRVRRGMSLLQWCKNS